MKIKFKQEGFSYVIALFLVAVVAIISLRALQNVSTKETREKEAQLLWVGQAYRNAIRDYYESSPGTKKEYPEKLDDLLEDRRNTKVLRPLRRPYLDPISLKDWGLIKTEDGKRIKGIYSLSEKKPIKTGGFPPDLSNFTGARSYKDWQFIYQTK